ncbi:hypothetical protein NGM10_08380 [Halorussus salilacus]|uniref:hypothetical protein n=1 Tax=Halorussus salilacus TaxID=2953750 RepID=UPI00209F7886|nr:hypothetical protein [Halorussus salilacus]USZ66758.1 hypothetical protein NGM10_08380 [Halorussus salilacus]
MQRRSATVYVALFLVIAAGSYALIGAAEQPEIDLEGETYTEGDDLTVNDRQYTVDSLAEAEGVLTWTNESARHSTMWENNSTTELENTTYRVLIPNESDPDDVTLREEIELDDNVSTTTVNETEYVVEGEGENRTLVPVDEYMDREYPDPETREFSEGDTFEYEGNETTVNNVTTEAAELTWTAPQPEEVLMTPGDEISLGPEDDTQTYVAHMRAGDGGTELLLSTETQEYQNQIEAQNQFNERIAGLWGIVILSIITVMLLIALAFLPPK